MPETRPNISQGRQERLEEPVAGTIRLGQGSFEVTGVRSPYSLMNQKVATYGETTRAWSAEEATGFGKLRALSLALAFQAGAGSDGGVAK